MIVFIVQIINLIMEQPQESKIVIKFTSSEPIIFQMQSQEVLQPVEQHHQQAQAETTWKDMLTSDHLVNRWQTGATIFLNLLYILMIIVLPIPSASLVGKYILISLVFISYIIYLTISYSFSRLNFMIRVKEKAQFQEIYKKYTSAPCTLNFTYAATRNRIDQQAKKYQQEYQHIKIIDRTQKFQPLPEDYPFVCIKYNKKYYYSTKIFKAEVNNAFSVFVEKCKSNYDKFSRRLLRSSERIDLIMEDFTPQVGFSLNDEDRLRVKYFFAFGLGFSAYFEYYMSSKVLRKSIDIVKEIGPK